MTILFLVNALNYSCVSIAEGNSIKKDVAKIDARYKLLENKFNDSQNEMKRKLKRVDVKLLEMDNILKEARNLLHRNNADFGQEMEQMDLRIKKVEGKHEEVEYKFEQLQKKFDELKQSINDLSGNVAMVSSANKNETKTENKNKKDTSSVQNTSNQEEDYRKINNPIVLFNLGYSYISGKKYKSMSHKDRMNKAISIFDYLIKKFPNHKKSDSARYWITQAYYSSAQYEKAYRSLNAFLKKYPKSRHIPQILFQMGYSLKELGLKKDAKTIFKTLIKLYPNSGYSSKAKNIIKSL